MSRIQSAPLMLVLGLVVLLWLYGPITQPADYHAFADQRSWLGLPHAADVLSNLVFLLVGLHGLRRLQALPAWPGRSGYGLFYLALALTSIGSGYYHLAPDDARIVWDRLPIALACAGLLTAHWPLRWRGRVGQTAVWVGLALFSVAWWQYTAGLGQGDLRPYLLMQLLPLLLLPLLQWLTAEDAARRYRVGLAMLLYVAAKLCELADGWLLLQLSCLSGHTLKHLLAGLAAWLLCPRLTELESAKRLASRQA